MGATEVDSSFGQTGAGSSSGFTPYIMSPAHQGTYFPVSQSDQSSVARLESPAPTGKVESSTGAKPATDRPVTRRPYHPNPPAHRSEWVMWAGNVPSDTTHDELWRFFNQTLPPTGSTPPPPPPPPPPDGTLLDEPLPGGVLSIFLISRSSCSFVNFDTEAHLHDAIARFNGQPLRPNDPRCPRLVCRARRKDDDLKAGVGGQRGMGMHIRWVKDQKEKAREQAEPSSRSASSTPDDLSSTPSSTSDVLAPMMSSMWVSSDDETRSQKFRVKGQSSSSGSYASTNSSVLTRYFPKRYFILKSLTQASVERRMSMRTKLLIVS